MKVTKGELPPYLSPVDKVILFDGVCKLCHAWSHFIIKYDTQHKFKLASVQSKEGKEILAHFNYPTDSFATMLVVHDDICLQKSDAFLYVMKTLGFPWRMFGCFKIFPTVVRNWCYDRVALNRYKLIGKYDTCFLPSSDTEKRFLNGEKFT
jgi:predicted DCC family thiol-disulfide oxidoreductase YuxK